MRWCGTRIITKALNEYFFVAEDLRNCEQQEIHGTRLKFYHDASLNTEDIPILSSETGMPVSRPMELVEEDGRLLIKVYWRYLPELENTWEPLAQVF